MNNTELEKQAKDYAQRLFSTKVIDEYHYEAIEMAYKAGRESSGLSIFELEAERYKWSFETFTDATALSSLYKLIGEAREIEADILNGVRNPIEYADVLMCLFDSASRQPTPIMPYEIFDAFAEKLRINKGRSWVKNENNTYSHTKPLAKNLNEIASFSNQGKKVVYIAGKVTGLPYPETCVKFMTRQIELENKGYHVINPMRMVHKEADWQNAMKICISFLPHADLISLLHDWQDSEGAMFEKVIADRLGINQIEL